MLNLFFEAPQVSLVIASDEDLTVEVRSKRQKKHIYDELTELGPEAWGSGAWWPRTAQCRRCFIRPQ